MKNLIRKNIINIKIKDNFKINKIINIFKVPFICRKFSNKTDKKIFIFEGASWVGYSYLTYYLLKLFLKTQFLFITLIILILSLINFLMKKINYIFEKKIFNKFNLTTVVSNKDKIIVKKIFNINSIVVPNFIDFDKNFLKKFLIKNYIFFSGSIEFKENEISFKKLISEIYPKIKNIDQKIKIVLTGSNYFKFKNQNINSIGRVSKNISKH